MSAVVTTRPRLAFLLAGTGGYVDAVGFLTLFGLFTGHQSGNTVRLGVELGRGNAAAALTYGLPIVVFFGAVTVGAASMAAARGRGRTALAPLLGAEAVLVALFMTLGTLLRDAGELTPRSAGYYGLAATAVAAMGLQTASLRHVSGVAVHTAFITGMMVSFAEELVAAVRRDDADAPRRAGVHGVLLGVYLGGAVGGAALDTAWGFWALTIPVALLAALTVAVGAGRSP